MEEKQRYCFLAFGELALDKTYNENCIIKEVGGVSAFNTLYNLSAFGEEAYAIGGVGFDLNAVKAIESLKKSFVNTDYIDFVQKPTNVFYIFKPQQELKGDDEVKIDRKSPITGKSSVEWSDKLCTKLPEEFENRNVILIVSNFEEVTKKFIQDTKSKCNNCKVSLDITNEKIFEKFSSEYLLDYLSRVDLLQCNEKTFKAISKKLNISNPQELFSKLNLEIFTLTKGRDGATFFFSSSNGEQKAIDKKPKVVAPLVDTTGAGDAFHSMLLMAYHRKLMNNSELDEKYFDDAFEVANALSRKVVQIEGARGEQSDLVKYMLSEMYAKSQEDEEISI